MAQLGLSLIPSVTMSPLCYIVCEHSSYEEAGLEQSDSALTTDNWSDLTHLGNILPVQPSDFLFHIREDLNQ